MNSNNSIHSGSDTILDTFFERTGSAGKDRVYLRYKPTHGEPYADISFAAFGARVREAFAGFARLGIQRGDRIAVVSESRPEWLIFSELLPRLRLARFGFQCSRRSPRNKLEFIVNDCEAKLLIVSNDLQLGKAIKLIGNCPSLQSVIIFNSETKLTLSAPFKRFRQNASF